MKIKTIRQKISKQMKQKLTKIPLRLFCGGQLTTHGHGAVDISNETPLEETDALFASGY